MLCVEALGPGLGAQVRGVDLSCELDAATVRALHSAWTLHGVLVFREQAIDDSHHAAFAAHFGTLGVFDSAPGNPRRPPEIYRASNTDDDDLPIAADSDRAKLLAINGFWHIDGCYRATPNRGVALRAVEVAPGGDTIFANLAAACATLPPELRRRITGRSARHSFEHMVASCGLPPLDSAESARVPPIMQPLIRQHENGRQSLFLSPPYMDSVSGLDRRQARALVDELVQWATQPHFLYRHPWRVGDLLVWDNAWIMHKVMPYDVERQRRVMHGATILGDEPVRSAT